MLRYSTAGGPEARRTPAFGELAAEGKYLRCAPVVSMLPNSTLRSQGSPRGEADRSSAQNSKADLVILKTRHLSRPSCRAPFGSAQCIWFFLPQMSAADCRQN